jgi:hypothetical protein
MMKITILRMIIGITALVFVTSGLAQKVVESTPLSLPSIAVSTSNLDSQQAGDANVQSGIQNKATQEAFSLPSGYQAVETTSFTFAIPNDWKWEKRESADSLVFLKDGEKLGETEILAWFDSEETWRNIKPNHSEQTDFQEVKDLITSSEDMDAHVYKIQLIHTKPAASQDPDWKYEETRWYVTVKEKEVSYGFYFNSDRVDESTMKTILSTFRLKLLNVESLTRQFGEVDSGG